jgi:hypothetical protein
MGEEVGRLVKRMRKGTRKFEREVVKLGMIVHGWVMTT